MVDPQDTEKTNALMRKNMTWLTMFLNSIIDLSRKTRNDHWERVEFFLSEYLVLRNGLSMEEGVEYVGDFIGRFCVENGVCTSPAKARSMATSIRKFYRCMATWGAIPEEDYDHLREVIRNSLPEWEAATAAVPNREIPNLMAERRRMIRNAPARTYRKGEGWIDLNW